jgi:hypothetical protein
MHRPKKLDPKTLWVVIDQDQATTRPFYHATILSCRRPMLSYCCQTTRAMSHSYPLGIEPF